ncbi:MAG: enoyl-CoA hydratase-related protein, partial [Pseudomonadota bacterium]
MSVTVAVSDGIAVATISNPPVNAAGHAVRQGLMEALRMTEADAGVRAVVLMAEGTTFVAGADVREFGEPPRAPLLPEVVDALESGTTPWICAIHGTALGGGLEIALGCHYRVALRSANLGLPEVKQGLIPGAGGPVRLPPQIAAEDALR